MVTQKCLNCNRKLKGEPQEYKGCCTYACWKKFRGKAKSLEVDMENGLLKRETAVKILDGKYSGWIANVQEDIIITSDKIVVKLRLPKFDIVDNKRVYWVIPMLAKNIEIYKYEEKDRPEFG